MENAYLIVLTGQGDVDVRLVNDDAWSWLSDSTQPVTNQMVEDYIRFYLPHSKGITDPEMDPTMVKSDFEQAEHQNHSVNDKALHLTSSSFNGEQYIPLNHSTRKLNAFLKKHKLTLQDEWYGHIY